MKPFTTAALQIHAMLTKAQCRRVAAGKDSVQRFPQQLVRHVETFPPRIHCRSSFMSGVYRSVCLLRDLANYLAMCNQSMLFKYIQINTVKLKCNFYYHYKTHYIQQVLDKTIQDCSMLLDKESREFWVLERELT